MITQKINTNFSKLSRFSDKFHLFQNLIDKSSTKKLLDSTLSLQKRRVICKTPNVSYDEQLIPENNQLFDFFKSDSIISYSKTILKTESSLRSMLCWTSVYQKNEYINPHKDASGHLQILICLKNDGFDNNGLFCFKIDTQEHKILLRPGDLIFFKATDIEHYTTPLIESVKNKSPIRIVAVARQFFNN